MVICPPYLWATVTEEHKNTMGYSYGCPQSGKEQESSFRFEGEGRDPWEETLNMPEEKVRQNSEQRKSPPGMG